MYTQPRPHLQVLIYQGRCASEAEQEPDPAENTGTDLPHTPSLLTAERCEALL